jgi:hypothetical protein
VRLTRRLVWDWSRGAVERRRGARATRPAECLARGSTLEPRDGPQGVEFVVRGRALAAGERMRIVYGAGPAPAQADRYRRARVALLDRRRRRRRRQRARAADSPRVDVPPGPPRYLSAVLPSTAEPGDDRRCASRSSTDAASRGAAFDGRRDAVARPEGLELPETVTFTPPDAA